MRIEDVDAVVVGCRPAGASTAIVLAQHGRKVIALDRAKFPSDTLSTHLMTPTVVATLRRLGALDRVLATGAPPLHRIRLYAEDYEPECHYQTPEGIDYGISVRRPDFDAALVDTAREAGVDVREGTKAVRPFWAGGRLSGVWTQSASGEDVLIRARAVIGADGRRSTVAGWVGSTEPYRKWPNQRGMVWYYVDDPRPVRDSWLLTRVGDTIGFHFPCNDGALVLLMPPRSDIAKFRADPEGMWAAKLAMLPRLRELVEGVKVQTKQRCTEDLPSFFRISSGPGWALVGDAGHFKDPVIGHGMHDAVLWASVLGDKLGPVLDKDDSSIDKALRSYERERDRGVLPSLYLAGRFTRTHSLAGPESELWRELEANPSFSDEFGNAYTRSRSLTRVFSFLRLTRWSAKSLIRAREDRAGVLRFSAAELKLKFGFLRDVTELALRGRARAASARRWRDGWSDAVVLSPRTAVMRNAPRTMGYHGKGASRPVPALNEAVGLLTAAGDNHDNLASLETR
jgi:2-polyprenyl-6-methoxyphenol hydroxylase-like FAD-dependent oxidoreductase